MGDWFWDWVSLCEPGCPVTSFVDQASLELLSLHLSPVCWDLRCTPPQAGIFFVFLLLAILTGVSLCDWILGSPNPALKVWRIPEELLVFSLHWSPAAICSYVDKGMPQKQNAWICLCVRASGQTAVSFFCVFLYRLSPQSVALIQNGTSRYSY